MLSQQMIDVFRRSLGINLIDLDRETKILKISGVVNDDSQNGLNFITSKYNQIEA